MEQNKDWLGALRNYKSLANLGGKLANDARVQSERVQGLIDREAALFQQAQDASLSGNVTGARDLYQQAADLHGDREAEAQDAIQKLDAELQPPPAPAPEPPPAAPPAKAKPAAETKAAKKAATGRPAKAETTESGSGTASAAAKAMDNPNCQLVASDIPRFLDLADGNRGKGKYEDAEREYSAVLECDAQNERAKTGLAKAKTAEAISGGR